MSLFNLPVEVVQNICSFLGGDAYVASMVPYLRPCVSNPDKKEFIVQVYERQDFAFIYLYQILPTYDTVERCVHALVEKENQTLLSWLLSRKPCLLDMVGKEGAKLGSYKILTWCLYQGYKISMAVFLDVLRSGNADLILYLYFLGYSHPDMDAEVALLGDLDMLREVGVRVENSVCYCAAQGGHLHILEWLEEQGLLDNGYVLDGALSGLQRKVILWLEDRKAEIEHYPFSFIVSSKGKEEERLAFLEWLDERVKVDYSEISRRAAFEGYIKIVRWCVSKARIGPVFLDGLFRKGTREDIEFFTKLGYYTSHNVGYYIQAAEGGDVQVLQWLEEKAHTVPNSSSTILPSNLPIHIVHRDNMPEDKKVIACLEYCLAKKEKEYAFHDKIFHTATACRRPKIFNWLIKNVPFSKETMDLCLQTAIRIGCVEIFAHLYEVGYGREKDLVSLIEEINFSNPLVREAMLSIVC
nr:hypothetical protein Clen_432 [Cedratvirus lena]